MYPNSSASDQGPNDDSKNEAQNQMNTNDAAAAAQGNGGKKQGHKVDDEAEELERELAALRAEKVGGVTHPGKKSANGLEVLPLNGIECGTFPNTLSSLPLGGYYTGLFFGDA